jgi:hypothetical protein
MPNAQKTMKWMSGQNYYESDFSVFATLLGYAFDGDNPVGRRVHSPGTKPDKDKLVDLYDSTGEVGFINGLLPLYDQLVRIFHENIAQVEVTMMPSILRLLIFYTLPMSVPLLATRLRISLWM